MGHHLFPGVGTDQVLVKVGQVHWQFQVLLLHSPVADAVATVAQPLRVLQVERQRAASAGWAEGLRTLAPAWRSWGGVASRPISLGQKGRGICLWLIAVVLWGGRCGRSTQSQGAGGRHSGELWFILLPLLRLLPLAAVILKKTKSSNEGV